MIELLLEAERSLANGQPDRAEQLYRQVADADPHNSIAVVGLGRVAQVRGDDLGAYLLARRALAMDPENEAARRLAAATQARIGGPAEGSADAPATTPAVVPSPPGPPPAPPVLADAPPATTPAAPRPTRRRRSILDRLRRR